MSSIPCRTLYTGATIPAIGLGTFGSDHVDPDEVGRAVFQASQIGYKHFDCASVYGNETQVGTALAAIIASGISRDQLWITSKLWNDSHSPDAVEAACATSIKNLGIDYLDAYLVHWPFPNHHPPGCDTTSRSPEARPYIHQDFMRTWRKMEQLLEKGCVKHIGTSNMSIAKLRLLLRDARIRPAWRDRAIALVSAVILPCYLLHGIPSTAGFRNQPSLAVTISGPVDCDRRLPRSIFVDCYPSRCW